MHSIGHESCPADLILDVTQCLHQCRDDRFNELTASAGIQILRSVEHGEISPKAEGVVSSGEDGRDTSLGLLA